MTTEEKALALLNEVMIEQGLGSGKRIFSDGPAEKALREALCRAIKQREAINTALRATAEACADHVNTIVQLRAEIAAPINPKPDPLVDVLTALDVNNAPEDVESFRAALDARGLEIREKSK